LVKYGQQTRGQKQVHTRVGPGGREGAKKKGRGGGEKKRGGRLTGSIRQRILRMTARKRKIARVTRMRGEGKRGKRKGRGEVTQTRDMVKENTERGGGSLGT